MRFWVGVFLLLILPISFVTGCDKNDGWDKLLEADDAFFVYSFYDLWDGGYTSLKSNIRLMSDLQTTVFFTSRTDYDVFQDVRNKSDYFFMDAKESLKNNENVIVPIINLYDKHIVFMDANQIPFN